MNEVEGHFLLFPDIAGLLEEPMSRNVEMCRKGGEFERGSSRARQGRWGGELAPRCRFYPAGSMQTGCFQAGHRGCAALHAGLPSHRLPALPAGATLPGHACSGPLQMAKMVCKARAEVYAGVVALTGLCCCSVGRAAGTGRWRLTWKHSPTQ